MTWDNFQRGQRCPHCADENQGLSQRLKLPDIKKIALSNGYEILSEKYENNSSKLKFLHIECKRNFDMDWNHFHGGRGCPNCAREATESKMASELKKYFMKNYKCIPEYRIFKNPETGRALPYDLYLVNEKIFIEINGAQHYKFIWFYHKNIENFEYRKKIDRMKRKFARANGIYIEVNISKFEKSEDAISYIENIIYNK
jgi:hypothetical protein